MFAQSFQILMQHAMSLFHVGLAIGGVTVVAMNLNLSKWTWALLVGFLLEALVVLASAAMSYALQTGTFSGGGSMIGAVFMVIRAGGLLSSLLFVGGLWGVFSDIQRRLAT